MTHAPDLNPTPNAEASQSSLDGAPPRGGPTGFVPDGAGVTPTWGEAVEEFLDEKRDEGCASGTVDQYQFALDPFARWMSETLRHGCVERLIEADARAFLRYAEKHGLSDRGPVRVKRRNELLGHLRRSSAWMVDKGYVSHNPFAGIKKKKLPERLLPELTPEHVQRLLAETDTSSFACHRNRVLFLFVLDTGLRIHEALSVHVTEELTRGVVTMIGKENKQRPVGLSREFMRELRPYLRARREALEGTDQPDSPCLFPNQWGDRLAVRTAQGWLKQLGERAGIEGVRVSWHTLRHTYGPNLIRQRGDSLRLMHVLGHSDLGMTRRYCEQAPRDVKDEMRPFSPLATWEVPPVRGRRMSRRTPGGEDASSDRG
ncbi:MAG: hypothetical protein FJX75_09485 [Armatimonadetes bacterium]|nr:hypothetical protein [Armatimonadota bacterium]